MSERDKESTSEKTVNAVTISELTDKILLNDSQVGLKCLNKNDRDKI